MRTELVNLNHCAVPFLRRADASSTILELLIFNMFIIVVTTYDYDQSLNSDLCFII